MLDTSIISFAGSTVVNEHLGFTQFNLDIMILKQSISTLLVDPLRILAREYCQCDREDGGCLHSLTTIINTVNTVMGSGLYS